MTNGMFWPQPILFSVGRMYTQTCYDLSRYVYICIHPIDEGFPEVKIFGGGGGLGYEVHIHSNKN